jgi:beta-phosphoglucomutase-like phosphatase (HAD superfamily)
LEGTFDAVVTFEDCERRKPNSDPYLITARKLGVDANECLVIEDSLVGLEAAKSAGMQCVIILNEETKNLSFSKADFVIESPEEIRGILRGLK